MLDDAVEAAGAAWWMMEIPSGAVFFSPNKIKMLGYSENDMSKFVHYESFTKLVHKDDHEPMMQAMRDIIGGKAEKYETTYRIKSKNGAYRTFYDSGKVVGRKKDGEIAIAGIVLDITDGLLAKRLKPKSPAKATKKSAK